MDACTFQFTMNDDGNFTIDQLFGNIKKSAGKDKPQKEGKNTIWESQTKITDQANPD